MKVYQRTALEIKQNRIKKWSQKFRFRQSAASGPQNKLRICPEYRRAFFTGWSADLFQSFLLFKARMKQESGAVCAIQSQSKPDWNKRGWEAGDIR
jgi:hypothetical protein